uniref:Uncharacterized protein n=1 Tax=Arundo donax TaxID=35708 RepID=A0A0A9HIX7_ARUDO
MCNICLSLDDSLETFLNSNQGSTQNERLFSFRKL